MVMTGTWMYAGTAIRRTRERRLKQRAAYDANDRLPYLRLAPMSDRKPAMQPVDDIPPAITETLPVLFRVLDPQASAQHSNSVQNQTEEFDLVKKAGELTWQSLGIRLQPVQPLERQPTTVRLTSCPFLEDASGERRCLAHDPKPITLKCQAAYCLGPRHRRCAYFRQARGYPTIPPERLAAYTVVIAMIIAFTVVAGLLAVSSGDDVVAGHTTEGRQVSTAPLIR